MCMPSLSTAYIICKGGCVRGGKSIYWQANSILAAHSLKSFNKIKQELQESSKANVARSFPLPKAISAWPEIACTGCCSLLPPCAVQLPMNIEITFYAAHCVYVMVALHTGSCRF